MDTETSAAARPLIQSAQVVVENGEAILILTGSSARKLRRGNANLLPGRVHTYSLGALTAREAGYKLPTRQALATGTLPGMLGQPRDETRRKTLSSSLPWTST